MTGNGYFEARLDAFPVMGIFRNFSPVETVALCERAWASGVYSVEIPITGSHSFEALSAAVAAGEKAGRDVGAGTVLTVTELEEVYKRGARFTVAPGLDIAVIERSLQLDLPHLPGVATSSEIGTAKKLGLSWVKAFPASELGTGWITAQLAPFPEMNIVATGGINAVNARRFLQAGCRAVAVGSAFSSDAEILALSRAVMGAPHST